MDTFRCHAVMPDYSVAEVQQLASHTVRVKAIPPPSRRSFCGFGRRQCHQATAAPAHFAALSLGNVSTVCRVVWNFAPPREALAPNAICRTKDVESGRSGMPIDADAAFVATMS